MGDDESWSHIEIAGVQLDVPADLSAPAGQGIEGPVAVLERRGMRLLLDGSAFADPLVGHSGKPGLSTWTELIDGEQRELLSFDQGDGSRVLATRLPALTATVVIDQGADPAPALRMLRSLRSTATPADGTQ